MLKCYLHITILAVLYVLKMSRVAKNIAAQLIIFSCVFNGGF